MAKLWAHGHIASKWDTLHWTSKIMFLSTIFFGFPFKVISPPEKIYMCILYVCVYVNIGRKCAFEVHGFYTLVRNM